MTEQESIFADGNTSDMEYHRGTVEPVSLACTEETKMEGVCCKRSGCVMDKGGIADTVAGEKAESAACTQPVMVRQHFSGDASLC